jgi:ABC-type uncharacterized transport system permease subunit
MIMMMMMIIIIIITIIVTTATRSHWKKMEKIQFTTQELPPGLTTPSLFGQGPCLSPGLVFKVASALRVAQDYSKWSSNWSGFWHCVES